MPVPDAPRITSRHHAVVQRCRRLARQIDDDFVLLDGEHVIVDALRAGVPIDLVLTNGRAPLVTEHARAAGAPVYEGTDDVLAAASPVRTSSGVVAIARWQPAAIDAALAGPCPLAIGLCGVQDPGNVGSAIRAADALGATGVLALDHSAHPGGWKCLRGAMGSTFHLPVAQGDAGEAIEAAKQHGLIVAAAIAADGIAADRMDFRRPVLLLLGGEGAGLSSAVIERADERVTIQMRPNVNSMNVAATAALLLYEARRQRADA